MTERVFPIYHAFALAELSGEGCSAILSATEEERESIARRFELRALKTFETNLVIERLEEGYQVRGTFTAEVEQTCVVSLEPIEIHIEDSFDTLFMRSRPDRGKPRAREMEIRYDEDDIEWYEGESIVPGGPITEWLGLALDPYPRHPDAELREDHAPEPEKKNNPFAVLRKLKDKA